MNSIILCEGRTDAGILKYYMEKVNCWTDDGPGSFKIGKNFSRQYIKNEKKLTIASIGGSTKIKEAISRVLEFNRNQFEENDVFSKTIVLTDHDDDNAVLKALTEVEDALREAKCDLPGGIENNVWASFEYSGVSKSKRTAMILPLIIPFNEEGAIETFILNSISEEVEYDRMIINKVDLFVDEIDPEKRYLNHRRLMTKAKYEVYFAVRATAEKHNGRDFVMKSVPWTAYIKKQKRFERLGEI